MKIPLAYLSAGIPLTKRFWMQDGTLQKSSYPHVARFTSSIETIKSIDDFARTIQLHADQGHCLLKGVLHRVLSNESRAGSTRPDDATEWLCLDFDDAGSMGIEEALDAIGLVDVDYVVQYSASHGIVPGLRCHAFLLLARPVEAPAIKLWLRGKNFDSERLAPRISLTASNVALRWPLDVSTSQNDKLIYIAPPEVGPGVKRTFKGPYVQLVRRKKRTLDIADEIPAERVVQAKEASAIKRLRAELGLAAHPQKLKVHQSTKYLAEPGEVQITSQRTERGFVYFNFNGGDSWGYYHPENDPTFIYNFKGEPTYLTRELLPSYWKEASKPKSDSEGRIWLAFSDIASGAYYRGHAEGSRLEINPAKNEKQLKDFLREHGQFVPDYVPTWSIMFNPHEDFVVDTEGRRVNVFEKLPEPVGKHNTLPAFAGKVLENCVGTGEVQARFLNWLAFIYQKLDRTMIAWLLHGVPGTGKGILINKYIRPTLRYVTEVHAAAFEEQFNEFLYKKMLVAVDEAELQEKQARKVMMRLKSYITEPYIPLRRLYSGLTEVPSYVNFLFSSNRPDPLLIELDDRRFSVANYGEHKLVPTVAEFASIEGELERWYSYLMNLKVDEESAKTPFVSDTKARMQALSVNSVEIAIRKLATGDFEWFVDQVPDRTGPMGLEGHVSDHRTEMANLKANLFVYELTQVAQWLRENQGKDVKMPMTREEIKNILAWCIDEVPTTPNKFTRMLHMHRFETYRITRDSENFYGAHVPWKADANEIESFLRKHGPKPKALKAVK